MKMYLISDNIDTKIGMRLAGVDGALVHTKEEIKAELDKVTLDKDIAIVMITEKLSKEVSEYIDDIKLNRKLPLIVEIPDRHGTRLSSDFITGYVREAIGVKL